MAPDPQARHRRELAEPSRGSARGRAAARPAERPWAVMVIGTMLVAGNLWAGALAKMDGWPLACYPLFNGMVGESYRPCRSSS